MEFSFDGLMDQAIDFDAANDTLNLNVASNQFSDISQDGDGVRFTTMAGAVLTLSNTALSDLTNDNVMVQGDGIFTVGDVQDGDDDDAIEGTAFSDVIFGLTDDDIDAGDGDNLIFGGNGRADADDDGDDIESGSGDDLIFGNAGDDEINSGSGNDTVYGGKGEDAITATPDAGETANLFGGGGEVDINEDTDTFTVGAAATGTADADFADGTVNAFGNAGDDEFTIYADGDNRIEGGRGNDDILLAGDGDNTVRGGRNADDGVDTIVVRGDGDNVVFGGGMSASPDDGVDEIVVAGDGNNMVYGNGDDDTIIVDGSDTTGANTGDQGDGSNQIFGGRGDDDVLLLNSGGNNRVEGNLGSDRISAFNGGAPGAAPIELGDYDFDAELPEVDADDAFLAAVVAAEGVSQAPDQLSGDNLIYGGNQASNPEDDADLIFAGFSGGNSEVYGNGGDDIIGVGANDDASVSVFGGQGDDGIAVNAAGDASVSVVAGLGDDMIGAFTSGDATVSVTGGVGDDQIVAIIEGSDDSVITAGIGDDEIGVDGAADVTINADGVNANEADGDDEVTISGSGAYTVNLGGGDDVLYGDGNNPVAGGAAFPPPAATGNIVADGGLGDDTLLGGDGNDELTGGAGDDVIFGGASEAADPATATPQVSKLSATEISKAISDANLADDDLFSQKFGNDSATYLSNIDDDENDILNKLAEVISSKSGNKIFDNASITIDNNTLNITFDENDGGSPVTFSSSNASVSSFTLTNITDFEAASENFDLLLGGEGDDILVGGEGSDVFGGGNGDDEIYLSDGDNVVDGDQIDGVDDDADVSNEVHFSTGLTGSDTVYGFDGAADGGNDFIALLDGDGSDGSVAFAAGDDVEGAQGVAFGDADQDASYFEFDLVAGTANDEANPDDGLVSDGGDDATALENVDNAVVVFKGFDLDGGDVSDLEGLDGLEDSYVVVNNGGEAQLYFDSNWGDDFSDAELVATFDGVSADAMSFSDFGTYGTDEGGLSA